MVALLNSKTCLKKNSVFLSRIFHVWLHSLKIILKWPKKIFYKRKKVSKNPEFHADFKSFEKGLTKCTKKWSAKMWRKYALFLLSFMFVKLVLLITFFGAFLSLFQWIWNQHIFIPVWIFSTQFFLGHNSTFSNSAAKRKKTAAKIKKRIK